MKTEVLQSLFQGRWYENVKYQQISGRYITNDHLDIFLNTWDSQLSVENIGLSVRGESIRLLKMGSGPKKILMWSQMHGNEATTTKAVLDACNTFIKDPGNSVVKEILQNCSLYIIPILNPDGARAYTRINANHIDLNRDMQNLSQPESRLLMNAYENIQPDFCLNLHDQRTIFSAGANKKPATLSFLTPSKDAERTIDSSRKISMGLIARIAEDLAGDLPGMIGRYDDAFNINCAGDTFQNFSTPTLLFEAGHYPDDYQREETRKYVFKALLSALNQIAVSSEKEMEESYKAYFSIPENKKLYKDIIIRQARINDEIKDLAIHYNEKLEKDKIVFEPILEKIAAFIPEFGHWEIMAHKEEVEILGVTGTTENVVVNKIILKSKELVFKEG